jgi:hypothetical protein
MHISSGYGNISIDVNSSGCNFICIILEFRNLCPSLVILSRSLINFTTRMFSILLATITTFLLVFFYIN